MLDHTKSLVLPLPFVVLQALSKSSLLKIDKIDIVINNLKLWNIPLLDN